jgi:hypothetical protein
VTTYRCAQCGVTESAADRARLDKFWITIPANATPGARSSPETHLCGTGCYAEWQSATPAGVTAGTSEPQRPRAREPAANAL